MRNGVYRIAHFLADTNLWMAAGAACYVAVAYWLFGLSANGYLVGVVFCGTLLMYNFQRWAGDLERTADFRRVKFGLMCGGGLGVAVLVWSLTWQVALVLAGAAALSLAYAIPVIGQPGRRRSLRKVPYLKVWVITAAWLLTGVVAPLVDRGLSAGTDDIVLLLLFALQQGALVLAIAVAFDIRDLHDDDTSQRTLPQILGVEGALGWARTALRISALACALLFLMGYIDTAPLLAHILTLTVAYFLFRKVGEHTGALFYTFVLDGVLVVQGVVVYVALVW